MTSHVSPFMTPPFCTGAPHRQRIVRHVVDVRILCQQVLGQKGRVRAATREERHGGKRVRFFQVVDDRELVRLVHLDDLVQAGALVIGRIVDDRRAEHDIVGIKGRAVRPLDPFAQMIRDREAVPADAAVRLRRHLGCEFGIRLIVLVPLERPRRWRVQAHSAYCSLWYKAGAEVPPRAPP